MRRRRRQRRTSCCCNASELVLSPPLLLSAQGERHTTSGVRCKCLPQVARRTGRRPASLALHRAATRRS